MKNTIRRRITGIILIAGMILVMNACDDDTESSGLQLMGSVTIPSEVIIGTDITADTSGLSGSGALSFVWEHSNAQDGQFAPISGETEATMTVTESTGVIEDGRYIRVVVTRADREGSRASNASLIVGSPTINGVSISIAGNVSEVGQGQSIQLSAVVTHDNPNTSLFQQVTWQITGGTSSTVTTAGMLHVGADEALGTELTITATSVIDPTKISDELELEVIDTQFHQITVNTFFTHREGGANAVFVDDNGTDTAGRFGTIQMDGQTTYYIERAVYFGVTALYPVLPAMAPFITFAAGDFTEYTRFSFDMAVENANLAANLKGLYPRFFGQASVTCRWALSNYFTSSIKQALQPNAFVTMEFPLDSSAVVQFVPDTLTHADQVLDGCWQIGLWISVESQEHVAGRYYFRNFRFY